MKRPAAVLTIDDEGHFLIFLVQPTDALFEAAPHVRTDQQRDVRAFFRSYLATLANDIDATHTNALQNDSRVPASFAETPSDVDHDAEIARNVVQDDENADCPQHKMENVFYLGDGMYQFACTSCGKVIIVRKPQDKYYEIQKYKEATNVHLEQAEPRTSHNESGQVRKEKTQAEGGEAETSN